MTDRRRVDRQWQFTHPAGATPRGRALFREALQAHRSDLPDVVWRDGTLIVVEP